MRLKRATARLYLDRMKKYLPSTGISLLEVGCGRGEFLLEARERGFVVNGLEIFERAVEIANERLNFPAVLRAWLEDSPFPDAAFDVIVFFDVIEHVRDPLGFLRVVHRKVKPGAKVFLCTPCLDSFVARLMGRHWMEYKVEHLFYFSYDAIKLALQRTGFRDVYLLSNRKVLSADYVYRHFMRHRNPLLSPIVKMVRKITPDGLANRPLELTDSNMFVVAEREA